MKFENTRKANIAISTFDCCSIFILITSFLDNNLLNSLRISLIIPPDTPYYLNKIDKYLILHKKNIPRRTNNATANILRCDFTFFVMKNLLFLQNGAEWLAMTASTVSCRCPRIVSSSTRTFARSRRSSWGRGSPRDLSQKCCFINLRPMTTAGPNAFPHLG